MICYGGNGMLKFPAKYTQIPNYPLEYLEILEKFEEGITKVEFEEMVSQIKQSRFKHKYKYLTHLTNLGLFEVIDGKVYLSSIGVAIKKKELALDEGLRIIINENDDLCSLAKLFFDSGYFTHRNKNILCEFLQSRVYGRTEYNTLMRYLTPIINLFNIAKINESTFSFGSNTSLEKQTTDKENYQDYSDSRNINEFESALKEVEKFYVCNVENYGDVLALQKIEKMLMERFDYSKKNVMDIWKAMYKSSDTKYNYLFTTIPTWSTKYKKVIINGQSFTHLIIINSVFKGEGKSVSRES